MSQLEETAITDQLDLLWPDLVASQEHYLAQFGKYFQGLETADRDPTTKKILKDGKTKTRAKTKVKPSDQDHDYEDFWRRKNKALVVDDAGTIEDQGFERGPEIIGTVSSLASAVRIDAWEGPEGKGWSLTSAYDDNGTKRQYRRHSSGEVEDWADILPEPII